MLHCNIRTMVDSTSSTQLGAPESCNYLSFGPVIGRLQATVTLGVQENRRRSGGGNEISGKCSPNVQVTLATEMMWCRFMRELVLTLPLLDL